MIPEDEVQQNKTAVPLPHNITSSDKACILLEVRPFMQQYAGKIIVIKYGGHAIGNKLAMFNFAQDIVWLKQSGIHPIVAHGGGPQIDAMLKRLKIESKFHNGLRITDANTINIVEMVLTGNINQQIVSAINAVGGRAVGLSGKDGGMVIASKIGNRKNASPNDEHVVDLGFVGKPETVDCKILNTIIRDDFIPVIAPIAISTEGETYNINADTFAGAIAGALCAERFLLLTDTPGVLDKKKKMIREISPKQARKLIANGTISGGMIPKIETCLQAIEHGVNGIVILNGQVEHATLLELYTERGEGTIIR